MSFDEVEPKIEAIERRWRRVTKVLPESVARKIISIEWAKEQRKRHSRTRDTYESHIETLERLCEKLESDVSTLRNDPPADPAPLFEKIETRITQTEPAIEELEALEHQFLRQDAIERFDSTVSKIQRLEEWVTGYKQVGQYADKAKRKLDQLDTELEPYEGHETYLTTPVERELRETVKAAEEAINRGFEAAGNTPLANDYLDELTELRERLNETDEYIARYNQQFINKETERYSDLFTNIDDEGHDLSDEQIEAVLHDDKYNLVVAGAGSGKTVTLTHRIAYLTQRRDKILPENILAISYTNNAADVMESRLEEKFGIRGVNATTFHSQGMQIIQDEWETKPEVFTEHDRRNFVEEFINKETDRANSEFKKYHFQFLKHFYDDVDASAEFSDKESEVNEIRNDAKVTLKQERVRSESEKQIADFLFLHQVKYKHQTLQAEVAEASGKGTYRADFYLPEYDIVISHHPVLADGYVPDWAEPDDYRDFESNVQWERERFSEIETELIETYEFEAQTDRLEDALRARLIDAGVIIDEMSYEDFIESAFDFSKHRSTVYNSYSSFINNARQLNLSPDEVEERISEEPPKKHAFGKCVTELYRAFCVELKEHDYIDFPGMLYQAIEAMKNDPAKYRNQYDQVLVDEFQDISKAEIEFLRQFVTADNDTTMFCVGDDWQSIYSFAGSEVDYFINFEEHFDTPHVTELTANYRCPETVVEAGNDLIRNNENLIDKNARPVTGKDTDIKAHDLSISPSSRSYRSTLASYTTQLIKSHLEDGASPSEIMVLSRSKSYYFDIIEECQEYGIKASKSPENEANPAEYVKLYSVHKSKGDEAEHVIIIHAVEDMIGFPSQVENNDLLEPVRIAPEDNTAEERRLFYVAMTRSSGTLDIVSSANHRSRFVDEVSHHLTLAQNLRTLNGEHDRIDLDRVNLSQSFDSGNSQTQAGILHDGIGSCPFVIWENSPHDPIADDRDYKIENAKVKYNDYKSSYEIQFDGYTDIEPVSDD